MPTAASPPAADDEPRLTVLVVAVDADLRRYVLECLRVRGDVRAIEAATAAAAARLADECAIALIIADEHAGESIALGSECRWLMLVDEVPYDKVRPAGRVRFLARPFAARDLLAAVRLLIG